MIKQNLNELKKIVPEDKLRKLIRKSETFLAAFSLKKLKTQEFVTFSVKINDEEKQFTFFDTAFLLPPAKKIEKGNGFYTAIYNMKDL